MLAQTPASTNSQPAIGAAPAGGSPAPTPAAPRTEVIGAPGAATTTTIQQPNGAQPIGQQQQGGGGMGQLIIFLPIIALFGFMMWTSSRNQKKERQRREEMINAISTNDTVQTIGGIIGRVAEIKDDEIILRVDESTNTKMRFTKAAVQQVVHKSGGGNAASQAEAKPMKQTAKV
ncbi:MAG: preprotein translocase subunit YajC [Phycisphaerales bacterium]